MFHLLCRSGRQDIVLTVVPILSLLAVCKPLSAPNQVLQLANGLLRVLTLSTVQITVKDTRVAVDAHENEGVREGLEPRADPAFERLANLGIVLFFQYPWQCVEI